MPLNFGAQTRGALCRLTSHVEREREGERERERESGAFHAVWPSATAAVTNNKQYKQYERKNERTNKQTNSRKFPVGLDLTNVIDMQSARASCRIRARDLPLTERVLRQLS